MSFSTRHLPTVLLLIFGLAVPLCAQSTTKQTSKVPRGTVSGRVTIKDKGAPGVAVSLRKSEFVPYESFLNAKTDNDGFYRISNVPAGSYEVAPSAPAFVAADNNRAQTVVVGEDENVEGINFQLIRGGVITGKVTDADGRPVIQQQVYIFRADAFNQQRPPAQRQIFTSGGAQTDDRGIYRMYGITAGRYKVATGRSDEIFSGNFTPNRTSYQQVFHPDVTDQAKATIVEVAEGTQTNDVDIKLGPPMQTFSVSGRVLNNDTGLPLPGIRFGLQRMAGQRPEFMNMGLVTNAQGDFFAEGLIPGKYSVYMFTAPNDELRAESLSFDIIDQDVNDLVIKLMKGATISGVVVVESNDKIALQKLSQMQVQAYVAPTPGASGFGRSAVSQIAADGSFRLSGLPGGTANIALGSSLGPDVKGFSISRVERDGVMAPRTVEIKDGEQVAGLRVIVSYGNATLRGLVKVENGPPTVGRIFVRLMKPGETGPLSFRPPPVDARGHFLMEGIPPGTYELHAQVAVPGAGSRSTKREIVLQDGVVTDVTITIDAATPPKP